MGVRITRSITKFLSDAEKSLGDGLRDALSEIAERAVQRSPVQTGAYVTSHTIAETRTRARGRGSHGKPKVTIEEGHTSAMDLLSADIAKLPEKINRVYLNNGAPHAAAVESRYSVFGTLSAEIPEILRKHIKKGGT